MIKGLLVFFVVNCCCLNIAFSSNIVVPYEKNLENNTQNFLIPSEKNIDKNEEEKIPIPEKKIITKEDNTKNAKIIPIEKNIQESQEDILPIPIKKIVNEEKIKEDVVISPIEKNIQENKEKDLLSTAKEITIETKISTDNNTVTKAPILDINLQENIQKQEVNKNNLTDTNKTPNENIDFVNTQKQNTDQDLQKIEKKTENIENKIEPIPQNPEVEKIKPSTNQIKEKPMQGKVQNKEENKIIKKENIQKIENKIEPIPQNPKIKTKRTKKGSTENEVQNREENKTIKKEKIQKKENIPRSKENNETKKVRELKIENGEIVENIKNSPLVSSVDIVKDIEKNILSNKKNTNLIEENIKIKKGRWDKEDSLIIEESNDIVRKGNAKIKISTTETRDTRSQEEYRKLAFKAIQMQEYEIAIKFLKRILEIDPNDNYSKLSLATSYHSLKQYRQAKPLYIELMEIFPNDVNIIANLLSIIVNESPYEAIYLIPTIAEKFENSAAIQAQTSVAFANVKKYEKAIEYIKKAIYLDTNNIGYIYNLAVLYDLKEDYGRANKTYKEVIKLAEYLPNKDTIPYNTIVNRIKILDKNKK